MVVARGCNEAACRAGGDRIHCARVTGEHKQERGRVSVPNIDLRILRAADDETLVGAAEARPQDEAALLVSRVAARQGDGA